MYIQSMLGRPYKWGGSDPMDGYDCGGLCISILQSRGQFPHGKDATAQGLYDYYVEKGAERVDLDYGRFNQIRYGLAFYGKSISKITHVAYCLDELYMVEAGGGGSKTKSLEDAKRQDAFVRIRPIKYRKDLIAVLDISQICCGEYF